MTAIALGILVERGQIQWDTPIHDILPAMSKTTALYEARLNIKDLLSHRTGKAWADALYLQSNNRILLAKDQSVRTFDSLAQVAPVRNKYMYNNHAYNLAGLVIEKICGQEWSQFMTENIFKPLGMDRTYTEHPTEEENVATPYNILSDRSPFRVPFCNVSGKTMMFAGQSVRTSVADLLKYSSEYLGALKAAIPSATNSNNDKERDNDIKLGADGLETSVTTNTTKSEPIVKQVATLVRPHVSRSFDTLLEQTYALGWNRQQLPGTLDFG
jgi:CubicO group peptidase (beta-lactamase class C family)